MSIPTVTRAYLAGAIDADGSIGITVRRSRKWAPEYMSRVGLKQVTPQVPELLRDSFGGLLYLQDPTAAQGRPLWSWSLTSAATAPMLRAILPHLRIKSEQARVALELCDLHRRRGVRRFPVPPIVKGEPMATAAEAAEATGLAYESVCQAVRNGSVPSMRDGRRILIPCSFLPIWAERGNAPPRDPAHTAAMHALYLRAKDLNRVGR